MAQGPSETKLQESTDLEKHVQHESPAHGLQCATTTPGDTRTPRPRTPRMLLTEPAMPASKTEPGRGSFPMRIARVIPSKALDDSQVRIDSRNAFVSISIQTSGKRHEVVIMYRKWKLT
ncbi:hypothetical protein WDZ92_43945, partial [Nostoc sp. NIES-2111]